MSHHDHYRSPDEIEADIHQSRAHLDHTLHEIEHRLSPQHLKEQAYGMVPHGGATEFFNNLGHTIRQNPYPVLLTGIGLGWLIMSQRKAKQRQHHANPYPLAGYREGGIPAESEAPQRMTAVHLGTQQGRAQMSQHRPDVVGVATHLGTGQGWNGYVRPSA